MLPAERRLRHSDDLRAVVRRGVRVGRSSLVVHALLTEGPCSRAGFVVSKAVGNAVTRNRVKRRLRHLVAPRLAAIQPHVDVVVRALPAAATGPLDADLESAWQSAMAKLEVA